MNPHSVRARPGRGPAPERLRVMTTGGTIEKTYDESSGRLANTGSVLAAMLRRLRLPGLVVTRRPVLAKDSLDITPRERDAIVRAIRRAAARSPVVVLHGTDTLAETARSLCAAGPRRVGTWPFTGACWSCRMSSKIAAAARSWRPAGRADARPGDAPPARFRGSRRADSARGGGTGLAMRLSPVVWETGAGSAPREIPPRRHRRDRKAKEGTGRSRKDRADGV